MRYDYIRNTLIKGSPGETALATRIARAIYLLDNNRIGIEDATWYVLRDFPSAERIMNARRNSASVP